MICGQILKKELTAPGYTYDSGLRDQNAIVHVLKTGWEEHKAHVLLINKQYCLNCYWKDLLQSGDLSSDDKKVCCPAPLPHLKHAANESAMRLLLLLETLPLWSINFQDMAFDAEYQSRIKPVHVEMRILKHSTLCAPKKRAHYWQDVVQRPS